MGTADLDNNGHISMWEFANQFLPEVAGRYIERGAELKTAKRDLACLEVIVDHQDDQPTPSKWWADLPTIRVANETTDNCTAETSLRRAQAAVACLTALRDAEREYLCYRIAEALREHVGHLAYTDRTGSFFEIPAADFDVINIDLETMQVELGMTNHLASAQQKTQLIDIPNLLIRMPAAVVQAQPQPPSHGPTHP